MATYTTRVNVPADRRITVDLPGDMPLGEAEVTVCVEDGAPLSGSGERLLAWMANRPPPPADWKPRTKEQIDRELREMRDEWDA